MELLLARPRGRRTTPRWRPRPIWTAAHATMADRRAGDRTRVLFLCTHNSARSQMAEGLLRGMAEDRFEVFSAGTEATRVRPEAISVMAEIGVDISAQESESLDRYLGETLISSSPSATTRTRPARSSRERESARTGPSPTLRSRRWPRRAPAGVSRRADEIRARIQGELAEQDV